MVDLLSVFCPELYFMVADRLLMYSSCKFLNVEEKQCCITALLCRRGLSVVLGKHVN